MTKTLTEQWKDGELPREFYYIRDKRKEVYLSCLIDYKTEKGWVKEVLAPVPSYEEYKELLRHSELSRNLVYEVLVNQKEYNELLDKAKENKRLQERLEIATKALEELETKSDKFDNSWSIQEQLDFIKTKCQETLYQLKEMDGIK